MPAFNTLLIEHKGLMIVAAAVAIFVAAVLVLLVFRLAFGRRLRMPGGRARQMRLGIVDAFDLDRQRQLVIVRRDNVEHLVMIGGPNDILIESQIVRTEARSRDKDIRDKEPTHVPAPASKPLVAAEPKLPEPMPMPEPHPVASTQENIPAPVAARAPNFAPVAPIANRPPPAAPAPRRAPPATPVPPPAPPVASPSGKQPAPPAETPHEEEQASKPLAAQPQPQRPLGAPQIAPAPSTPGAPPPFFRAPPRQPLTPAPAPQPAAPAPASKAPTPQTVPQETAPAGPPVPSLEGLESLEEEMAKLLGRSSNKS